MERERDRDRIGGREGSKSVGIKNSYNERKNINKIIN